jgi:hypothetical protein
MFGSDFPGLKDEMLNEPAQLDDSRNQLMTAADVRLNAISESVKKIMSGSAVKKCSDDLLALSAVEPNLTSKTRSCNCRRKRKR